jgi:putative inorganic carbon (hco3(-)) transporter
MTELAAVVGAAGALLALLPRARAALVAGLVALAAAEISLGWDLVPGGLSSKLTSAAGIAAIVAGGALLAGLAALLARFPAAVPPLLVAAAPFRLPFEFGAGNRFFLGLGDPGELGRLLPLYAVIGAAGLALVYRALRDGDFPTLPRRVAVPAALFLALMTLSLIWAYDAAAAEDRLVFFVIPFAALLATVARAPFRPWLPRVLALEAVALASLFALVGLAEAATHRLLFYDPKVAVANSYTSYFRVTSLFSDPSIYGRHLVIGIAVLLVALWLARIGLLIGIAFVSLLWAGLFFSYSQSSMVALAAVVVVVGFLVADPRMQRAIAVAAGTLALTAGVLFVTLLRDESAARVTSNRSTLVGDTAVVFGNHPLVGVGVASQPAASRDESGGADTARRNTSHTAPLTVAAELGVVGVLVYVAFLTGAVWLFAAVRRRDEALGLALLAVAVVLFVHSLVYGVFVDDPLLWATLGIAVASVVPQERVAPARLPAFRRRPSTSAATAR